MLTKALFLGSAFWLVATASAAVPPAEVKVTIKKKLTGSNGTMIAPVGKTVKVVDVTPPQTFMQNFQADSFKKIVLSVCDKEVLRLGIRSLEADRAEVVWTRKMSDRPEYQAIVENNKGELTISCQTFVEEAQSL